MRLSLWRHRKDGAEGRGKDFLEIVMITKDERPEEKQVHEVLCAEEY